MSGLDLLSPPDASGLGNEAGTTPKRFAETFLSRSYSALLEDGTAGSALTVNIPLFKRNQEITKRTGKSIYEITKIREKYPNTSLMQQPSMFADMQNEMDKLIEADPITYAGLDTYKEIQRKSKSKVNLTSGAANQIAQDNPDPVSRFIGTIGGSISGTLLGPANIATAAVGAGPLIVGKSGSYAAALLKTMAAEGALQAGIEAAQIPARKEWFQFLGREYGLADAAADVGLGFVGGAALRGIVESAGPAAKAIYRGTNSVIEAGKRRSSLVISEIRDSAPDLPQTTKDALTTLERQAYIDEGAPTALKTVSDKASHRSALETVGRQIEAYERPSIPTDGVSRVTTPRNDLEVEVKEVVVDLDDLVTSDNPAFDQRIQPRDRADRATSELRINDIAAKLDPMQLAESRLTNTGAPIVGPDMMVESGNGRVMALKKAYDALPEQAEKYRSFLKERGYKLGSMKRPVLIRQRLTPLDQDERARFALFSNEDLVDRLSIGERAVADAKLLDDNIMSLYEGGDFTKAANAKFVRAFVDTAVSGAERNSFYSAKKELAQDGVRRIEAAMLARAYESPTLIAKLLEDTDNEIRTIGKVLIDLSGQWARLKQNIAQGVVSPSVNITDDLLDAVETIIDARATGKDIGDILNQQGLFSETSLTDESLLILQGLYKEDFSRPLGAKRITDFFKYYLQEAEKVNAGQNLLGQDPLIAVEILDKALKEVHSYTALTMTRDVAPEIRILANQGLKRLADRIKHPRKNMTYSEALQEMNKRPSTWKGEENLTDAQIEKHDKIIESFFDKEFKKDRVAEIIIGPAGAGKSSVVAKKLKEDINALEADSDLVKNELDGFDDGIGANAVHLESRYVWDRIIDRAVNEGTNLVIPTVGQSVLKVQPIVDKLFNLGYTVNIRAVIVSPQESLKRVVSRFGEEGRVIPPSVVLGAENGPSLTYSHYVKEGKINEYTRFQNEVPRGTRAIVEQSNDPRFPVSETGYSGSGLYAVGAGSGRIREVRGENGRLQSAEESRGAGSEGKQIEIDTDAYRLREYRDQKPPDVEIKPSERLELARANFDELLNSTPEFNITREDGSEIRISELAAALKEDQNIIDALTVCRLA